MKRLILLLFALFAFSCSSPKAVPMNATDGDQDADAIEAERDTDAEADGQDVPETDGSEADRLDLDSESEREEMEAETETEDPKNYCSTSDRGRARPCPFIVREGLTINPGCGHCENGLVCQGDYFDGRFVGVYQGDLFDELRCESDADCRMTLDDTAYCLNGYCGLSYCGREGSCNKSEECEGIGMGAFCFKHCHQSEEAGRCLIYPWGVADWGWCQPEPGDPCTFTDDLNKEGGACSDAMMCLGMLYNKPGNSATCKTKEDCAKYGLTSKLVGCSKGGYCGISFCSADAGDECTAIGGTEPKPGQSAVCEALPYMNSERYGKACCQVVSGKKLCIPDSLCPQEGAATAGQACKEPAFEVNPTLDFCASGLNCAPHIFPDQSCLSKADCATLDPARADCVSGRCAISFCTSLTCQANADCPAESYGAGACCSAEVYTGGALVCAPAALCGL